MSIVIFQLFDTTFIVRFLFLVKIGLSFSDYFIIGLKFLILVCNGEAMFHPLSHIDDRIRFYCGLTAPNTSLKHQFDVVIGRL